MMENIIDLKYDIAKKQLCQIKFLGHEYEIFLGCKLPDDLISTFEFLMDYKKASDVSDAELKKLTQHMFSKLRYFQSFSEKETKVEYSTNEPITLRQIAYDLVKESLETRHEANLDELTEKALGNKYPIEIKQDSIRASISSVVSALRNGFRELEIQSWSDSVWRGKTTGRNPHLKVASNFIMPSYILLWERYNDYLEKKKRKR